MTRISSGRLGRLAVPTALLLLASASPLSAQEARAAVTTDTILRVGEISVAARLQAQERVALYNQAPQAVINALTTALVDRGEMAAMAAPVQSDAVTASVRRTGSGSLSVPSRNIDRATLESFVPASHRQYANDIGGRYALRIAIVEQESGGTQVRVNPIIVVTIPGSESPLGGRPLPSNGSIEAGIFTAIAERLPGGG
jgi:hypothetical protein